MLYHWLGWASVVLCAILLTKYIGRVSKIKKLNVVLRTTHKVMGIMAAVIALLHGIISFIKKPLLIPQNITGIISFSVIILLAGSFYAKSKLKKKWLQMHRWMSVSLIIAAAIHVVLSIS